VEAIAGLLHQRKLKMESNFAMTIYWIFGQHNEQIYLTPEFDYMVVIWQEHLSHWTQ
jgi:hypothetical protein